MTPRTERLPTADRGAPRGRVRRGAVHRRADRPQHGRSGARSGRLLLILGLLLAMANLGQVAETHAHGLPDFEPIHAHSLAPPAGGSPSSPAPASPAGWDGDCALCGLLSASAVFLPYRPALELPEPARGTPLERVRTLAATEIGLPERARAPPLRLS